LAEAKGEKGKENEKEKKSEEADPKLKYENSVIVRISDELRVKADGVVIFPHEFAGNTVCSSLGSNGCATGSTLISTTSTTTDSAVTTSAAPTTSASSRPGWSQPTSTTSSTNASSAKTPVWPTSKASTPASTCRHS
jgi:hypothetical protein